MEAVASRLSKTVQRAVRKDIEDIVVCRWWTGRFDVIDPARFRIDAGGKLTKEDLHECSALGQEIKEKYQDTGLIHVQNTGLSDMGDQRLLARIIMGDETEYEGGANPRGRASELGNVYDIGAPLEAHLHYHHEMTYKSHSVETLGFLCKHAITERPHGWTFVSDSVQAHDQIMETELGQKLKDKGLCFIRHLTDANAYRGNEEIGVYNHWQQSWITEDPSEAQEAAEAQGLQVRWKDDPVNGLSMETRYYISAFEYVPSLDRNILMTSIADDGEWFDSWPGISELPQEERPMEMLFGDDTPISLEEKQLWTDVFDNNGVPIQWAPGDVAVVCNLRYAHGRPGVHLLPGEKRELGVMLGPLFARQQTRDGKW